MSDPASKRHRAIVLMREALALLDEAKEDLAGCHLQAAIDTAERIAPANAGHSSLDERLNRTDTPPPADPVLIRAMGGALALLGTVIGKGEATSLSELSRLLGIYAAATHETSPDEGLVLACWGAMLRDVADAQQGGEGH